MKGMISIDNGTTWLTADEAIREIREHDLWDAVTEMMDYYTREEVADDLAPCTDVEYLREYLSRADHGLCI